MSCATSFDISALNLHPMLSGVRIVVIAVLVLDSLPDDGVRSHPPPLASATLKANGTRLLRLSVTHEKDA